MHHVSTSALLGATALAPVPRAVHAAPRADASNPAQILAKLNEAFEEYKKTNDDRLKAKADDTVVNAKLEKIDQAIEAAQKALDAISAQQAAATAKAGGGGAAPTDPEYSTAWGAFFREGENESQIKALNKAGPRAAMTVGSNPDGGYLAPVEWDRTITARLKEISPIRQNAQVQSISKPGFTRVYNDRTVGSGWVAENAARPATSTPQVAPLTFTPGELYAFPFASQTLLEDAEVDIEGWLASEVETEFSRQENIAFLSGDGSGKPYGILTYVTGAANAARHPWGAIDVVNSGGAAAITSDGIITLIYTLPDAFRAGAKMYMNRLTRMAVRKLKDGQGNYLWQPSYQVGQPSTLAGEAIVDVPDMPNVAAGNIPILYGDMASTYLVVDRVGISVLRDALTNKPYVGFYTRKRVGGGVQNPEPMKAMKISA